MTSSGELVKFFGTEEMVEPLREVSLGPLSFILGRETIRQICWNEVELIRAIAWPVRDPNWVTLIPEILSEAIDQDGETLSYSLSFAVGNGALMCELAVNASQEGSLRAQLNMRATETFATNRAGFTVLHPIANVAGGPVSVTHADRTVEDTEFPRLISPGQPVMDIIGLHYAREGATVTIAFSGEVFEMEDQRNWSDASYKTYCVPLVHPFTYEIKEGECRTQSIDVSLSGGAGSCAGDRSRKLSIARNQNVAPDIGLAVERGWLISGEARQLSKHIGPNYLALRVSHPVDPHELADLAALTKEIGADLGTDAGFDIDIEIVLPDAIVPLEALQSVAAQVAEQGIIPTRVVALRECYLASHQPSGPWPDGPVPSDVVQATRQAFPDALIGGGMLTNFTEFNRCRPAPTLCDFVSHGTTAIVHASDDLSVRETLEALPQIFDSTKAIGSGKPYRLGLVSIGMRSNPYGASVADNPDQIRQTMAKVDPRQRGLFAAAWAVGALAATTGGYVDALCLGAPSGPFGIVYEKQDYPQPIFDQNDSAVVYPLYHVFRSAAAMAGKQRLVIEGLPAGVHGYGVGRTRTDQLMIANVTPAATELSLGDEAEWSVLDIASFDMAISHANWLDIASRERGKRLSLAPYAVAFVKLNKEAN
ncbi:MAG: hypothetical protein ACR2PG_11995 [Hyphomicrobiaceae bacterium]